MKNYKTRLVSGILIEKGRVLLGFRINTKAFAEFWSLPVGHVKSGESDHVAIVREMAEELGITVLRATPVYQLTDEAESIFHQVYKIDEWITDANNNQPENREPELCRELKWHDLKALPNKITPITQCILDKI